MSIWCGHDGSFHDDDGDGPADLSDLDEEIAVGWQDPFTDWNSNLFEGMGQYGVYTVTDPWEPADFPAVPYPAADAAPHVWPAGEPIPPPPEPAGPPASHAPHQQPESPLSTPSAPGTPTTPHFGPPPGSRSPRPSRGGGSSRPGTIARGTMTGFDFPFTDEGGHLLMDPHPSHQAWPWPMTYGDPVMTGWEVPFTDLEGKLLSGAGQYGVFTMADPYDHRSFNNVDLDSEKLIGDSAYYYTGTDEDDEMFTGADADAGQQFGSALGSMFGSASGNDGASWGQAGKDIASSIEQGSDSGDWGSALATIATSAAKVAIPAIVKATQSTPSTPSSTPAATTPAAPTPPATTAPHVADPRHQSMLKLMTQMRTLAKKYGIAIPPPRRAAVSRVTSPSTAQQLQQFMQSVASQGTS